MTRKSLRDWAKIQAEYVTGDISYRDLAKKHAVSLYLREDWWTNRYNSNMSKLSDKERELVDEAVRTKTRINDPIWEAASSFLEIQKAKADLKRAGEQIAKPATPDKMELAVIYSFDIKDQLKERGYKFDPNAHYNGFKPVGGWIFSTSDADKARAELQFLASIGVEIDKKGPAENMLAAVILGRPELAGL